MVLVFGGVRPHDRVTCSSRSRFCHTNVFGIGFQRTHCETAVAVLVSAAMAADARRWLVWCMLAGACVFLPRPGRAECPNLCYGHGTCGLDDRCSCHGDFMGPDCSQRVCPYDYAFVDTAIADDDAHQYAECSGKGTCNRDYGECSCQKGFTGA